VLINSPYLFGGNTQVTRRPYFRTIVAELFSLARGRSLNHFRQQLHEDGVKVSSAPRLHDLSAGRCGPGGSAAGFVCSLVGFGFGGKTIA
jgi:hypothetical protein